MIISLIGICLTRVFYVFVLFPIPAFHGLKQLYISYPVSWTLSVLCLGIMYKKIRSQFPDGNEVLHPVENSRIGEIGLK